MPYACFKVVPIPQTSPPTIQYSISQKERFSLKQLDRLMTYVLDRLNKWDYPSDHFVVCKLHQALLDFKLFTSAVVFFNQPTIDSQAFPCHFRNSVVWFNYAIEGLLHAYYGIVTGFDIKEHNFLKLAKTINELSEKGKIVSAMLIPFNEMNRLGRYPFSSFSESHSEIHQLLLKAERIREHPECFIGFELPDNVTSLNYIACQKGGGSGEELLTKWSLIVNETLTWVENSLLPLLT